MYNVHTYVVRSLLHCIIVMISFHKKILFVHRSVLSFERAKKTGAAFLSERHLSSILKDFLLVFDPTSIFCNVVQIYAIHYLVRGQCSQSA